MAKEIVVFDLNNPSSDPKIVKVDIGTLIRSSHEGEEEWLLKFYTLDYSDIALKKNIKSIYLDELSSGWYKSSGLVDTDYIITGGNDSFSIQIDNSIGIYTVTINHGEGLKGEVVARDIKEKINGLPDSGSWVESEEDITYSYRNCNVKYKDKKFYILSGSSGTYSGDDSSSVRVSKVSGDSCFNILGFDLGISSEVLDTTIIDEFLLGVDYISNTENLNVGLTIVPEENSSYYITDGSNEDYFICISGSTVGNLKVQTYSNNSYIGIKHNYLAGQSKIQLIKSTDPDFKPTNYTSSVDEMIKWGINNIANKIDYGG